MASLGATSILQIVTALNFTQIYSWVSPTPKSGLNDWEWKSHKFESKKISPWDISKVTLGEQSYPVPYKKIPISYA